ncbi:MAG: hypothetical protein QM791_11930 [Ferruginibacter sp.]
MQKQNNTSVLIAVLLVVAAAVSRVVMYPHNFSPMVGMAIFAGATFTDKRLAFALPLASMLLSDVLFEVFNVAPGFWGFGQVVGYGIFALITIIAFSLKKVTPLRIAGYSLVSSVIFFLLSNLSFFLIDNPVYHTYPQNLQGFADCYVQALPFFRTAVVADLVYSFVLFGGYYLFSRSFSKRPVTA